MKRFIPRGDKFIITSASFIAPQTICGFAANKRYTLDACIADRDGNCILGSALSDDGEYWLIDKAYYGPFDEKVVLQVHESCDNHRAQKKAMRFRRMAIRAYVSVGLMNGWTDTKLNPNAMSKKRIKALAREWAATIITESGEIDRISYMIETPDHEINQHFFDEIVYEELSCW